MVQKGAPHNIGCLLCSAFLPLSDHFEIQVFLGLKCKLDLALRRKQCKQSSSVSSL